jgi:hypothetical protein
MSLKMGGRNKFNGRKQKEKFERRKEKNPRKHSIES